MEPLGAVAVKPINERLLMEIMAERLDGQHGCIDESTV
jgi:hypothetical protein